MECRRGRFFAIACLGKKDVIAYENLANIANKELKLGLFDWVKELSKSNQTRCGVSPLYLMS